MRIVVGEGSCGIAAGALKIHSALEKFLSEKDDVKIGSTGCIGMCFLEPIVDIYDGENLLKRFVKVLEKDATTLYCQKLAVAGGGGGGADSRHSPRRPGGTVTWRTA